MKEYRAVNQKPIIMLRIFTEMDQSIFIDTISSFVDQMKKILYVYAMLLETQWKFEEWKCFWISAISAVIQFWLLPALGQFM